MSTAPVRSRPSSRPNFLAIFNAALKAYKRKTKNDLTSHPLLPQLESCDSPKAILTVLREQMLASSRSQFDGVLIKSITTTVNVLYSFSTALGGVVGLAFSPANIIFAGIGVLLLAAENAYSRDNLIDLFIRIEHFFRRLEIYSVITPTVAMREKTMNIMAKVLSILVIATKEARLGRIDTYSNKILIRNADIDEGLRRLNKLTQEVAQMASVELPRKRVQIIDNQLDRVSRNQPRDQLLRWLSPSDPSTNHIVAFKAYHNGTGQWLLQGSVYNHWKSTGCLLWIHGKPGSGKTILCSSIILDIMALREAGMAFMAYFYFDFKDVNKQSLHNLLPSLLCQLSARSDPCFDILSQLYSAHDRGARKPSDRAMVECLEEMLTFDAQQPTYIILDALDECPITSSIPSPRGELLEFVIGLVNLRLPNLHICVTSRLEHDIQAVLEHLTPHPVTLHDESGQQQDITDYVTSFVYSNEKMRRWRQTDKVLVIKTLSENADGMFRYVYCQLDVLQYCLPPGIRRVLEELPETLDETYERILRGISKPNRGHARRLLHCLAAAARPLRVEELAKVLAIDFDEGRTAKLNPAWRQEDQAGAVMSVCSSLVIIVKDGDSLVV